MDLFPSAPAPEFADPRAGDIYRSIGSPQLAADLLNFHAETSLADGLKQTVEWMKSGLIVHIKTLSISQPITIRNRFVLIGDIVLIIVSVLGSFALRYDVGQMSFYFPAILIMSGVALLVKIPTYYFFGLYRRLWMYASTNELKLIAVAVSTASVLTAGVMLALSAAD